jgi:hypothetical protein
MPYEGDLADLIGGCTPFHDEDDAMMFGHDDGRITAKQAARIADEVMADTSAPRSDGPKPGPRRNRHMDGFGGRNNA